MKKVFCLMLIIAGGLTISSCASLFQEATPFQQYPYAADGDGYILPNGRLVHKSLNCPNIQSTSGYKRVSISEHYKYDYSICYDCYFSR